MCNQTSRPSAEPSAHRVYVCLLLSYWGMDVDDDDENDEDDDDDEVRLIS